MSYLEVDVRPDMKSVWKAYREVRKAIKAGDLNKTRCTICGYSERVEAHHESYEKPLEVTWLCHACHLRLHRGLEIEVDPEVYERALRDGFIPTQHP